MKFNYLKLILLLLFIILLGVVILPQFKINIFGKTYTYNKINLNFIDPASQLLNLRRSTGISSSKSYKVELQFSNDSNLKLSSDKKLNILKDTSNIINKRIYYSYLYDVSVLPEVSNDKYYIKIIFPEYYYETDLLVSSIIAKGVITFSNDPSISSSTINLKDSDITGSINAIYDEQYRNVLQFSFKDSVKSQLSQALSNSKNYFLMNVDSTNFAVIANQNISNSVLAIPFSNYKDSRNISNYVNIVKSYFYNKPIDQQLNLISNNPETIKGSYLEENPTLIAIVFIVSFFSMLFASLIVYRRFGLIKFGLMLSSYIVLYVFLLKIESAILSIYTIVGFIFMYIISNVLIWKLLDIKEYEINKILNKYRDLSILLIILLIVIYKFVLDIGITVDFIGSLLIGLLSLVFMCIVNFKQILIIDYISLQTNIKILLNRGNILNKKSINTQSKN